MGIGVDGSDFPNWDLYIENETSIWQYQGEVRRWVNYNFGNMNELATYGGMVEEVGEIMRAVVKRSEGIRGSREVWTEQIKKETADVFIKLCDIAQFENFDLESAVCERWQEIRQRDWRKDSLGHGAPSDS